MKVILARDVLQANKDLAGENRRALEKSGVLMVNLISGPGAGKTTLLEKTIAALKGELRLGVIEGDICTTRDAERIQKAGVVVVQINTDGACHLDASLITRAFAEIPLESLDLLFIENVGNLVCPAEFDLGEDFKVALLSVSEGSDKPAKYPLVFREAQAVVINKIDLLPYTDFDLEAVRKELSGINGSLEIFPLAAKTGEGVEVWSNWLKAKVQAKKSAATAY